MKGFYVEKCLWPLTPRKGIWNEWIKITKLSCHEWQIGKCLRKIFSRWSYFTVLRTNDREQFNWMSKYANYFNKMRRHEWRCSRAFVKTEQGDSFIFTEYSAVGTKIFFITYEIRSCYKCTWYFDRESPFWMTPGTWHWGWCREED